MDARKSSEALNATERLTKRTEKGVRLIHLYEVIDPRESHIIKMIGTTGHIELSVHESKW